MNQTMRKSIGIGISFLLLACNLGTMIAPTDEPVLPAILAPATKTLPVAKPTTAPSASPAPYVVAVETLPTNYKLQPCSLVTGAEAELVLDAPIRNPSVINGDCVFRNGKDAQYTLTATASQGQQSNFILQEQTALLKLAGGHLDEDGLNKIKLMAAALDYKGFFSELVTASQGVPNIKARIIENGGSDLVYWAWITVDERRQATFVALRGPSLVNINQVVADSQTEDATLAASTMLANKIFERLPAIFALDLPTVQPAQPTPGAAPSKMP